MSEPFFAQLKSTILEHKYFFLIFLLILAVGLFVRTYQFEPWLHFELDQARDAKVIDEAFSGSFWDLPLLGPKAGGTFLRLAPGFYYLQYGSGLLFGHNPAGISWLVAILSFLTLPLLYLFLRRGFNQKISLSLMALASVCVFLVLFGRFGWNPNLLPFFLTLGFYALLRAVDKDNEHPTRWFLLAAASLAFATHFHFLAFLAVPVITIVFLLIKRARFSMRAWAGAILVVGILYLPMILNEVKTGGTNTSEFFGAITEKSTKEQHTFIEKAIRNVAELGQASVVVLTGYEGATFPSVLVNAKEWGTVCDSRCDKGKWYGVLGVLFVLLSTFALLRRWWKARNWVEADFFLLSGIWLAVAFVLYLPLSYAVAPRFYLLIAPLFFVLLGCLVSSEWINKRSTLVGVGIIMLLVLSNAFFLHGRLDELRRAGTEAVESRPDRILKERVRVTFEQQEAIAQFLKDKQEESGYPIYMASEPQHQRALKYLLERDGVVTDGLKLSNLYLEGKYFLVLRSSERLDDRIAKYIGVYTIGDTTKFGTLTVVELFPKPELVKETRQDFSVPEKQADSKAPPRYTWREFFGSNGGTLEGEETEEGEDEN
jgi:4-amino-4-deoxy-L-arabinose transferase-like glycosyltransferase